MPEWQANWIDVVFDHQRALATAASARDLAGALRRSRDERHHAESNAGSEWRGQAHEDFKRAFIGLNEETAQLEIRFRALSSRLETASSDAKLLQVSRQAERDQWQREYLFEQLALQG